MKAPKPSIERCAYASSTPPEPPPSPVIARKVRVPKNHWCSSRPRLPSGFSRLCSGPAPKPSSEIEKPATRTFVIRHSLPYQPSQHCEEGNTVWRPQFQKDVPKRNMQTAENKCSTSAEISLERGREAGPLTRSS